jgi:hypothetical protein
MVKIIVFESGLVDLEAPIQMTDAQRKQFIAFFQKNFGEVSVQDIEEPVKNMGERESTPKKWTVEEFALLLGPETNEELTIAMGRTIMSVTIRRGGFVPEFLSWCEENEYRIPDGNDLLQLIKLYMEKRQ